MIRTLSIQGHDFVWGSKTYIMGILNLTPDSFSGDGLLKSDTKSGRNQNDLEAILELGRIMVENGADILDIGGESTRPGAELVGADEELGRVLPAIHVLAENLNVIVS